MENTQVEDIVVFCLFLCLVMPVTMWLCCSVSHTIYAKSKLNCFESFKCLILVD